MHSHDPVGAGRTTTAHYDHRYHCHGPSHQVTWPSHLVTWRPPAPKGGLARATGGLDSPNSSFSLGRKPKKKTRGAALGMAAQRLWRRLRRRHCPRPAAAPPLLPPHANESCSHTFWSTPLGLPPGRRQLFAQGFPRTKARRRTSLRCGCTPTTLWVLGGPPPRLCQREEGRRKCTPTTLWVLGEPPPRFC